MSTDEEKRRSFPSSPDVHTFEFKSGVTERQENMVKQRKYLAWIPADSFGGCEDHAVRVANHFRKLGWAVTVVCPHPVCLEKVRARLGAETVVAGPDPVQIPRLRHGLAGALTLMVQRALFLARLRPDVVHASLPGAAHSLSLVLACALLRLPLLATVHTCRVGFQPKLAFRWGYRWAHARGVRFSTVSLDNQRLFCRFYGLSAEDVPVIFNRPNLDSFVGLSPETRTRTRKSLGLAEGERMALTVAALREQKGHDLIPVAAPEILRHYPEVRFVWAGDGDLRKDLTETIDRSGWRERFLLLGQRDDIPDLLAAADIFLFPTRFEGESSALAEAAFCALPIVVSRASGIPDLLQDGRDAYLFPVDNAKALAEAMRQALSDPVEALRRGRNAQARFASYTEKEMFADAVEQVERSLNVLLST
jgi:glycosyltransferase involved in cell wall biosynthesis